MLQRVLGLHLKFFSWQNIFQGRFFSLPLDELTFELAGRNSLAVILGDPGVAGLASVGPDMSKKKLNS